MFQLGRNTSHVDRAGGRARGRLGGGVGRGAAAAGRVEHEQYGATADTGCCTGHATWTGGLGRSGSAVDCFEGYRTWRWWSE